MRLGKQRYESKYMAIKYFYENNNWSINWMCRQLSISRAAYYKWLHREIPIQEQENIQLANLIKEYDERFNHISEERIQERYHYKTPLEVRTVICCRAYGVSYSRK